MGGGRTFVIPAPPVKELKTHWRKWKKVKEAAGDQREDKDLRFPNSLGVGGARRLG